MSETQERRRKARQQTPRGTEPRWIMLQNVPGRSGEVRARVVDLNASGVGIILPFWLRENDLVVVKGLGGNGSSHGTMKARVAHCNNGQEGYRAGLLFEDGHVAESASETAGGFPDYYELLQISTKADPDMIHRVFRLLAQRYHPDNVTTGDEAMFRAITEAYRVLSDPEKRASYDVNYQAQRMLRWQIFDQRQAMNSKAAEKAKRRGILELLYTARRNQPEQPAMGLHELEDLLGCPREHLEFSLWYLKENGLITRSDNARFTITAKGVDYAEAEFDEREEQVDRLLPAAQEPVGQPT